MLLRSTCIHAVPSMTFLTSEHLLCDNAFVSGRLCMFELFAALHISVGDDHPTSGLMARDGVWVFRRNASSRSSLAGSAYENGFALWFECCAAPPSIGCRIDSTAESSRLGLRSSCSCSNCSREG